MNVSDRVAGAIKVGEDRRGRRKVTEGKKDTYSGGKGIRSLGHGAGQKGEEKIIERFKSNPDQKSNHRPSP